MFRQARVRGRVVRAQEVPEGMPQWCHLLFVVPVGVVALGLLGSGGRDPFATFLWAVGAFWATRAAARGVLRRGGHPEPVARRWVDKGLDRPWLVVPVVVFMVWLFVDALRTALSPTGDWWSWVVVALSSAGVALMLLLAWWALDSWRHRRAA